ncbi:MAG: phospholipase D-like domain-containing protein [Endomicrobium sp.]|jgi:cardiolipin synthase|nr:phospholipase D-like domain-containing protein [Endomicrobium sp.]
MINILSCFKLHTVFITCFYIVLSTITSIHILLNKDDIKGSIGWIGLVYFSPFVGTLLYIFFGINRVQRKGIRLRINTNLSKRNLDKKNEAFKNLSKKYKQFIIFGYNVFPQNFIAGNFVEVLQNGTEAYPEMIKTIQEAKKEILISSYIFNYDNETKKFIEAFKIAVKNKVKIKILIDGIGTLNFFKRSIEKELAKIKNLEYAVFLPPQIPLTLPFVNLRNHRKIIIVDRLIAFLGSMNLSENNVLINDIKNGILDITFKIKGPVINQIFDVFEYDWEFVTKKEIPFLYKEKIVNFKEGTIPIRIISDGPDNKNRIIELIIHGAINMATKKILIITPYFLPENNILTAIKIAAMRNINVEIMIPDRSDFRFIDIASAPNFLKLINSGVKIYRISRPFDHSKILIIDNEWIFVGSANWDARSFKLNFESNMEIFSNSLAKKLTTIAELKKKKAKLITAYECENISILKKIRNNAYRLFTPYA